ncbi:MAG: site-specific DNA-methyltransferase [Alphaproteobacteria bacterium]|nr:site-specific DNA-methyltransferase [Alphaproteobacteria bacterium]
MKSGINLKITHVPITALKPYERNARTHSDRQIQQIANSIKKFGFLNPVMIDGNHRILAGHGRVEAAKRLQLKTVPVVQSTHLSEDEMRAYILADNRIAQNAGWDRKILAIELQHLSVIETDIDVAITGFMTPEIDVIIDDSCAAAVDSEDDEIPPADESQPAVTKLGDIWHLGKHRLICGDSLDARTYQALMHDSKAHMVFTDPPYNVPVDGHVCGSGKIKHREFAMASGEMSKEQFTGFLSKAFEHLVSFSTNGSLHFICMDWRHIGEMVASADGAYTELKNLCVWAKDNGGMGSLYRSQHELVFVFKNGTERHLNNVELGKHGRYRTNLWSYPGVNTMRKGRLEDLEMHPTVKPVAMVADAIKDCTKRGELILDVFAGSGTTVIAAEKTQRIARAIELDPLYCDVILKRWRNFTGEEPVHFQSGKTFSENSNFKETNHE